MGTPDPITGSSDRSWGEAGRLQSPQGGSCSRGGNSRGGAGRGVRGCSGAGLLGRGPGRRRTGEAHSLEFQSSDPSLSRVCTGITLVPTVGVSLLPELR